MRKLIAELIAILVLIVSLSGTVSAAGYDSDCENGLNRNEIEAMAFLKSEATKICGEDDSDYEKVRKLNKYVCDRVNYDYSEKSGGLTAFVNEDNVICSGYAEALAYLLDCVNVRNFTVTDYVSSGRSSILHIWKAVYVDGKWLHVDPTWNDKTRSDSKPDGRYFLLTCSQISKGRQTMSLKTEEDYNDFYEFIRTITLSLEMSNSSKCLMQDGRLLVPLSETVASLGGYVSEDGADQITVVLNTRTLNMTIGSKTGFMDGEEFRMDAAPQIINGTVMVPARLVFEKLGASVNYDSASDVMTIAYDPYQAKK
jgi:hypothetical protein